MTATLLAAAAVALVIFFAGPSVWLAVAAVPVVAWVYVLAFFRDPARQVPDQPGLFVSPADGCIADITPVGPDSALGRDGLKIGVFMNVFNCHVNRSPCDATVLCVEHRPGSLLDVRGPEAIERNESALIRMSHTMGPTDYPVIVRQVAGLVARRIVTDLQPQQTLRRGQRIGMIKFGSRLELWLPAELVGDVPVRPGQKVRAGVSVLARCSQERCND